MDWKQTVFEIIDLRSFSNLWYWIVLAVLWSSVSHWVLGVPYDMVLRARRHGGQTMHDLEHLVGINTRRIMHIARVSGLWLLAFTFFVLTSLAITGFYYKNEFAQAVFLLGFPVSFVGALSLWTAHSLEKHPHEGVELCDRLRRHRFWIQVIGIIAVFVTALWGMMQNLTVGGLGI